jgi:CO/xanthine dehydrogenase Mo-binding subunit
VVEGTYEVGMQDQAFLGPETALALPAEDGGVDVFVSTQWLHSDQLQIAASLDLPPEKVRLTLGGVGGAFGAREDVSLQIHVALLARHTGKPVKMMYSREESFFGHVHRHPARMRYRHVATPEGRLVKVEARLLMDGGAYASTSSAVLANAACFAHGPYNVPHARIEGFAVRTNNPSCGAMRGFGAVQTCFGHESQMDKLAAALGLDPVELRLRNALQTGDRNITGQVVSGVAPVRELLERLAAAPLPVPPSAPSSGEMMGRPGGAGRTADARHVRRGIGYAVGWKNLLFSEGFDDYSTARVRIDDGVVSVQTACAEVGQGFVTLAQQIARTVLGLDEVVLLPADTSVGSAGSTSASRQTWMSGGAVDLACRQVLQSVFADVALSTGLDTASLSVEGDTIVSSVDPVFSLPVSSAVAGRIYEATYEHHHEPTVRLDGKGQGKAHVSFAFAAHRAVVDVDPDLGLVRVVDITTTQDVGRILNPVQALGQIEGGIAQGVGLAVMEEIIVDGGKVRNASFTDYLIPTALDMPSVTIAALIEEPEPGAPFGAKGIGEPPTIASTAAVAAAIRNATGKELPRVPVRPQDITGV